MRWMRVVSRIPKHSATTERRHKKKIYLRFIHNFFRDEDITNWFSQVFAPADEVLTTPRLEFRLTGLKPSTTYKVRGKLYLHNLPVEPESEIYTVRTLDLPTVCTFIFQKTHQ